MSQFKFGLDPSSKKYVCPQCKQKTMVVYLDNETKAPVDVYQFGRCDRENTCGYHHTPYQDPEHVQKARENFVPTPAPVVVQVFPEEKIWRPLVERTKTCISPLHTFLNSKLLIPNDHLLKWDIYSDSDPEGNNLTVYIYRNAQGQVCNLKWFKYKEDGHRDKNFNSYSLRQPSKSKPPPTPQSKEARENFSGEEKKSPIEELKYQMCLYGEHLLDPEKKKPVCIVESEKSAAIASFFYSQFDWVACGSNNGLTDGKDGKPDKITVLKGREVYWLNDADAASRMSVKEDVVRPSSVRHLIEHIEKFYIADLFPERNDGHDIGDSIIDGLRPEIKATWTKGKDDIVKVPEIGKDDDFYDYDLPTDVDFEKVKWDIRKYMHFEHKGKVFIVRKRKSENEKGGTYFSVDITNFTIKSLGLIASKADPRRLIEITNIHGLTKVLQVPTSAFTSANEFTNFIESEGNYQYDGVGTDLKKVRARMYDTMEMYEEVESLGWHRDGYFLFANGAYNGKFSPTDKYGFVKLGDKRFYIEALSALSREAEDDWEDEKKFIYKERKDVKLKDWANLFCKVHKDNGSIAMAWYITSLFRDFIYQRFKFFPLLFLFGPPGTGKSQVGWSIRATGFAGLVKPFNLNTGTAVAFHREFAHFKNFPAWCDEYDNSIDYQRIQALKAAYDGVGHKKSVKDSDKRTKATQVNRGIMISGQQLPIADNALFKRVILLQFNQTEFSDQEKKIYSELQDMEDGGLTHITAGFTHFRKLIEETYMKEFDGVIKDMMKDAAEMQFDPEDRIVRNSAIALTTIKVLHSMLAESLPFNYEELKKVMMVNMKNQMSLISNANETNTFWDMVMFLSKQKNGNSFLIEEGYDFCFESRKTVKIQTGNQEVMKELEQTTELLFIRFTKIIPLYKEAFKKQNASGASPMDKGSLTHYLTHSKAYVGLLPRYNFKDGRTSCYAFNYEMLKNMGVFLGGSERSDGGPPPLPQQAETVPQGQSQKGIDFSKQPEAGTDDLPF